MTLDDIRKVLARVLEDHQLAPSYAHCTCGHPLPDFGLTSDRQREHLVAELAEAVTNTLNDALAEADW